MISAVEPAAARTGRRGGRGATGSGVARVSTDAGDVAEFSVVVERTQDESVLVLAGELDVGGATILRESVVRALEGSPSRVVFDVAELTFIDSSGLGVLASTVRRLSPAGQIVVKAPSPNVRKVLELTGLNTLLVVEDD